MTVRPGSARPVPPCLPEVFFAGDQPRSAVVGRMRAGVWEPVSRGAYAAPEVLREPGARALARIVAVHRRMATPHWFSDESAALLWGLPVWRHPETTLRQPARPGSQGRDPSVARHVGLVPAEHQADVDGTPVTAPSLHTGGSVALDVDELVQGALADGMSSDDLDFPFSTAHDLTGLAGAVAYLWDCSAVVTAGRTGNLAVAFLGSHAVALTVVGVDPDGACHVRFTVRDESSLSSGIRPLVLGYTEWYATTVGPLLERFCAATGIGRTTTQVITWTETTTHL